MYAAFAFEHFPRKKTEIFLSLEVYEWEWLHNMLNVRAIYRKYTCVWFNWEDVNPYMVLINDVYVM